MIRLFSAALLLLSARPAFSQTISAAQQQALNNYVDYFNDSREAIDRVTTSIVKYYPDIKQYQAGKYRIQPRYACPLQQEDYFYNKALADSKALGSTVSTELNQQLKKVATAAADIDATCKALDTYHKLEDFKQDNFKKAEELITKLVAQLGILEKIRNEAFNQVETSYKRLQPSSGTNPYHRLAKLMVEAMAFEKKLLDAWTFNLQSDIHTGWNTDELKESILATDKQISLFDQINLSQIKYPASSMVPSFKEGLRSILENKRNALDGYNNEARTSDKHSNDAYLGLINYYNGTLVSFYNSFVKFAQQDGFHGLKYPEYMIDISIKTQIVNEAVTVIPFKDIPHSPINAATQATAISMSLAASLNNYIDFINDVLRQSKHLQLIVGNFSSSASRYRGLTSFEGKGALRFDPGDFKVPLAQHQKTISESNLLTPFYAKNLNGQTDVLLDILKEMEQLSAILKEDADQKRYEKDNLDRVYSILERYTYLFEVLDERKEQLYADIRSIYDSYPLSDPKKNWIVSWKALRTLVDRDHEALFQAKDYYKGKSVTLPQTNEIDSQLREVLANEYENMNGIEKLGRYNGRCPYSPYEDIPKTSRTFVEKIEKIPEAKSTYRHPYHDLVYLYNDVVDDHNKFCELSNLPLLRTIHQPEFFEIRYPEAERKGEGEERKIPPPVAATVKTGNESVMVRTTERDRVKVVHDTVYIEKRDTVYLSNPDEDLRSMEGYATNNMVLLVDVSGSMNTADKLPLLKQSLLNMLSMMREEDQVSLVVYSGKAKVILQPTSFKQEDKIRKAINDLKSSGKTDGNAGITLAYQVADKNYVRGGNNRIILATDGEFPISTDVFSLVEKFSNEDIFISVFNFGSNRSSSRNLERLTATGRGNYEYITPDNMELKLIREAKAKRKK